MNNVVFPYINEIRYELDYQMLFRYYANSCFQMVFILRNNVVAILGVIKFYNGFK